MYYSHILPKFKWLNWFVYMAEIWQTFVFSKCECLIFLHGTMFSKFLSTYRISGKKYSKINLFYFLTAQQSDCDKIMNWFIKYVLFSYLTKIDVIELICLYGRYLTNFSKCKCLIFLHGTTFSKFLSTDTYDLWIKKNIQR